MLLTPPYSPGKFMVHGGNQDHHFLMILRSPPPARVFNHLTTKCKASSLKLYKCEANSIMELSLTPLFSISA